MIDDIPFLHPPSQWDQGVQNAIITYKAAQASRDSMALDSPWLNLMRNAMNAHIWSFEHPDSLSTSATHSSAHPAIIDEPMWNKYRFARLTDQTNNFGLLPRSGASLGSSTAFCGPPTR
jgi:outer membrane usher protein FimD/PapC